MRQDIRIYECSRRLAKWAVRNVVGGIRQGFGTGAELQEFKCSCLVWSTFNNDVGIDIEFGQNEVRGVLSGSWTTHVNGGQIDVGLQAARTSASGQFTFNEQTWLNWTLVVHPDEPPPPVPAISDIGLGIMLLFIVAVGGFVFRRVKLQEA